MVGLFCCGSFLLNKLKKVKLHTIYVALLILCLRRAKPRLSSILKTFSLDYRFWKNKEDNPSHLSSFWVHAVLLLAHPAVQCRICLSEMGSGRVESGPDPHLVLLLIVGATFPIAEDPQGLPRGDITWSVFKNSCLFNFPGEFNLTGITSY